MQMLIDGKMLHQWTPYWKSHVSGTREVIHVVHLADPAASVGHLGTPARALL